MSSQPSPTRREVAVAGHTDDGDTARRALGSPDPVVRATALGALERLGLLTDDDLTGACTDDSVRVRRRAAELAARHTSVDLLPLLHDPEDAVIEMAAWAAGEHESDTPGIVRRLVELAGAHDDPLVRESAVAALGAIGAPAGLEVILRALDDKPAIRRRAVLALAPFEGGDVDAAVERALTDRDWQVRQAAEDLQRAVR